ncbi:hypothetical protein R70723_19490 [Paenibacillus sp. FSL R7-0273]|uniref:hypothetical protein n=1 Tax=Paenibacillus sp. FSL R7-0273 TaxID=1536772 RepID=UPI0004F72A9F|nr:hypothetical protein [Paenibacillus sp. FSL R7-0273]AIQ47838.1 hypothetical protein R70723_19490 [Paenibacillus sp. FSL R7-0273]OMF94607.1 hypothetical protein BK144_08795 [Paenibacillus sp. FSL R7-0273]
MGKMLISFLSGLIGFLFTFLTNYGHNLLGTSLIRGIYGFILWFVLAFFLRWVLGFIVKQSASGRSSELAGDDEALGGNLDLSTPDEDEELINLLKQKPAEDNGGSEGFTPLQPPKLVSMKDPEELAKAVRHLKEE